MTLWTHYWTRGTVEYHRDRAAEGAHGYSTLNHTASNLFGPLEGQFDAHLAKVRPGDTVYCVSYFDKQVHLLARLIVDEVVNQRRADAALKPSDAWPAKWHLLATPGTEMRMHYDLILPMKDVKKIGFVRGRRVVHPVFTAGYPDRQTFRAVRELSEATAAMFDDRLRIAGVA